jgi:hypothetical protein
MNPNALRASTAVLRSALASLKAVAMRFRRRVLAAHDLEQRHDVGRHEEVQTDDFVGTLGHRGHLVDVERRSIRSEDALGLHDPVELREDFFLDVHVFEDGLDDDVGVGELIVVVGELHRLAKLPRLFLRHAALLDLIHEHAHHGLLGFVDGCLVGVDHVYRDAGLRERDCDARSHRSRANDAGFLDVERFGGRKTRNLGELPLGKEHVTKRSRRLGKRELHEEPPFARETELEGQFHRAFDCIDELVRGVATVVFRRYQFVRLRHDERRCFVDQAFAQPRLAMGDATFAALAREVDRGIEQIACD